MQLDLGNVVRDFLRALENRNSPEDVLAFYHPDIQQIEYPNTLTRNLTTRGLADLALAAERGAKVLVAETYDLVKMYVLENSVIIEAVWTGTLAIPLGNIPAGGQMKAYFAQFFEFRDGKILRQRNYDCFEPFQ